MRFTVKDVSIGVKLIGGFLIVAFLAAIVGAVGIASIAAMNRADEKLYEKYTVPIGQLQEMITSYLLIRVTLEELRRTPDAEKRRERITRVRELRDTIDQDAVEFAKTLNTREGREHLKDFTDAWQAYKPVLEQALTLGEQDSYEELLVLLRGDLISNSTVPFEALVDLVSTKIRQAKRISDGNSRLASNATMIMSGVVLSSILIGSGIGWFITRQIRQQLGGEPAFVAELAGKVAKGDLSSCIDITGKAPDSIVVAMHAMSEAIRALVADTWLLSQAAVEGRLTSRADPSRHQGDFRRTVVEVNNIVANIVRPLRQTTELLHQEVAERRKTQELLVDKQRQLETMNMELEERVAVEVQKSREKDRALIHSDKMVALGQLAAGVAHEINNPAGFVACNLRAMTEYFDEISQFDRILREQSHELPGPAWEIIEQGRKSLEIDYILSDGAALLKESLVGMGRITKIVRDLKGFARVDDALECEPATLSSCLESALTLCYNELKYVAKIRKEYGSDPEVLCHPGQLNQVFLNLLINAGHAIVKPGEIVLRSWYDDDFVYASVSDTGPGIPEEIRDRIMTPFFTTKEVGKGTGLGLSISYDIIKKHQGELLLESVIGQGATFTVKLPRTSVAAGAN